MDLTEDDETTEEAINLLTDLSIEKAEQAREYIKSLFLQAFPDDKSERTENIHHSGVTGVCIIILADAIARVPAEDRARTLSTFMYELGDYVAEGLRFEDFRKNNEAFKKNATGASS
jgi:hypothetical protein